MKTTEKSVGALLRRLVRQDREDHLAVKLLPRIVFGIAAAFTLFHVASSSAAAFTGVAVLLAVALLCWLLRHRKQLLLALIATPLTAAVTGYLTAVGDTARGVTGDMIGGQAVFGYWALAGMALLGAWMLKEHPGRRGVTVLLADGVLIIASFVGALVPSVAVPIGFLGVLTVLALRGRGIAVLRRRLSACAAFLRRVGTHARTGD
ncbi:hypothetical protein [Streptomyces purpurogeneiscleroticus]|uniref:hypothetical protein n=1 Tax=Streptomyces purpurogeneiscleroticus TaxID=68259 RepID=UPI001CC118FA|nr:hypothetical protein [Streptomyces purpurogeneiscleroticus]MBZ4019618.1 hypothetical protein [Streptomyces purpurogeneiscleroticus]